MFSHSSSAPALREGCVEKCPGCSHRKIAAEASHTIKFRWLEKKLEPWVSTLAPLVSSELRWGYRSKACLRAEWNGERWGFGLHVRRPGTHEYDLVEIPNCPIHVERVRAVLHVLSVKLPGPEVMPLVFVAFSGTLLTLVVKARDLSQVDFLKNLDLAALGFTGLWLNLNPGAGDRVFSSKGWRKLWGEDHAVVRICDQNFIHGPDSFQQLIPELYEKALGEALDFLAPKAGDAVIDLCSGIGVSLGLWKKSGADFIGVELGGEAVACALKNIGEGSSLRGRASERIPQLQTWMDSKALASGKFLAFVNPPRLGLESQVTEWLANKAKPIRMAYLSCSAGTLARDLSIFVDAGYSVRRIGCYDFFPQTHHVETMALLELDSSRSVFHSLDSRCPSRTDG